MEVDACMARSLSDRDVQMVVAELQRFDGARAQNTASATAFEHHISFNMLDEFVEVIQRACHELTESQPQAARVFCEHIAPVLEYYNTYTNSDKMNLDTTDDIVNLYTHLTSVQAQSRELAAKIEEKQREYASVCTQVTDAQAALSAAQRDVKAANAELEAAVKKLKSTTRSLKAKETTLQEVTVKLTNENKDLVECDRRLRDVKSKHTVLKKKMDGLREDQAEILEKHISRSHFDAVVIEIENTVDQLQQVVDSVPIDMQDD